jgi:acetyltransferase-like isoleucine patch superfamily enzyme
MLNLPKRDEWSATATLPVARRARHARQSWYVARKPRVPRGWLVYSEGFVLRVLQGKYGRPEAVRKTPGWRLVANMLLVLMGAAQLLVMLLAVLPVLTLLVEFVAINFGRGSVGFFLRACYWKTKLGYLGQDTLIDRGVHFWGPRAVRIGSCCHLDSEARIAAGEAGQSQQGEIVIGDYTHIGPRCNIAGRGGVSVGDFVSIQALVHIYSATTSMIHPAAPGQLMSLSHMAPHQLQYITEARVRIDNYVSIGFAALVLPGSWIGQGAVVHPYSLVSGKYEAYANISGPGRARQNGWRYPPKLDPRRPMPVAPTGNGSPGGAEPAAHAPGPAGPEVELKRESP